MKQPWNALLLGALAVTLLGCFASANLDEAFDDSNPEPDGGPDGGSECEVNGDCTNGFACNTATGQCFDSCDGNDQRCAESHYCVGEDCVDKKSNGEDCANAGECASNYCDEICCDPGGLCCKEQCSGTTPVCSTANTCVACTAQDSCSEQYPATPVCKTGDGTCVECVDTDDCRTDVGVDGGVPALSSPLGICTTDNVCTCWVETETDSCSSTADCPADNFVCADDYETPDHKTCLRTCSAESLADGIACTNRATAESGPTRVWVPMTTCYAFDKLWSDCPATECSVDGAGPLNDGFCINGKCTYNCWNGDVPDDDWCRGSYVCETDALEPFYNRCMLEP